MKSHKKVDNSTESDCDIDEMDEKDSQSDTEDKVEIAEDLRNPAKDEGKGSDWTPTQFFAYFLERCKTYLHIVLCFSPIGNALAGRIRDFPSIVNCTTIDWFSEWPKDAL